MSKAVLASMWGRMHKQMGTREAENREVNTREVA